MESNHLLHGLPNNFKEEERVLCNKGIKTWIQLRRLTNQDINELIKASKCTYKNLNNLRAIGTLICDINLSQKEASLLIHSGIASVKALANSTPNEIIRKIEKLERLLKIDNSSKIKISLAKEWINKAKGRQITN